MRQLKLGKCPPHPPPPYNIVACATPAKRSGIVGAAATRFGFLVWHLVLETYSAFVAFVLFKDIEAENSRGQTALL